jgi:PAS domain S-box-containing protein
MDRRLDLSAETLDAAERVALQQLAERLWDERAAIATEWSRRLMATMPEQFPPWVTLEHLSDVNAAFLAAVLEPFRGGDLAGFSRAYYAMNRQLIEFALQGSPGSKLSLTSLYASSRISLQVISEYLGAGQEQQLLAFTKLAAHLMMIVGLAYSDCREENLQRSRDQLERAVEDRTAALRETNAALEGEIAERGRIEASLRREKALSDTIIETLPGLFYVIDASQRLVRWNHELEKVSGYAPVEIAGRRPLDFFASDARPLIAERLAEAFAVGHATVEAELIGKDGRRHPRLFTSKRVELDQATYVIGVAIDIAARREAEERVQREKLLSDTIIDTLPGIFYLFDDQGRFLRWNENFERVSQFSAAEVAAMSPLDFFAGADREHILMRISQVFRDGQATAQADFVAKDGSRAPYFFTGQRVFVDQQPCCIGTGIDITERKLAEDALQRRTQELARSNADLEQFAYVASHDLQEPLRVVASYTQLLARRYHQRLDGDAQRFIERTTAAVGRMQALIRDLLAYSRVGTRGDHFEAIDCDSVLRDVLDNLHAAIAETGAAVTHDPLPVVAGDPSQIRQLFQNLIGNAIKFRRDEPPRVHVGAHAADGRWRMCVRDNGIGFEAEYAERIFVIFQRLHSRRTYPGTGVGLAICKKIVERHGGRMWVESEVGKGSTFWFDLPADEVADSGAAAATG